MLLPVHTHALMKDYRKGDPVVITNGYAKIILILHTSKESGNISFHFCQSGTALRTIAPKMPCNSLASRFPVDVAVENRTEGKKKHLKLEPFRN